MTKITLSIEEARKSPAFHDALSGLRASKSKKRRTPEARLEWFYTLGLHYLPLEVQNSSWEARVAYRLTNAVVHLCCKVPGKGQKTYQSTRLNFVPAEVRSHVRNEEIYVK